MIRLMVRRNGLEVTFMKCLQGKLPYDEGLEVGD